MVSSTTMAAAGCGVGVGGGGVRAPGVLPLASLNHISIVCRSVEASLRFYTDVLGFVPIRRPGSFDFDGAWYACLICLNPTADSICCLYMIYICHGSGCSTTGSASTCCSRRTPAASRRKVRSTPRTTISHSRSVHYSLVAATATHLGSIVCLSLSHTHKTHYHQDTRALRATTMAQ